MSLQQTYPDSLRGIKRWHDVAYWGLLAVACAVFWWMNVLTPFKEDDMGFTLVDGVWSPVQSFGDFLQSCRNHYLGTNGRLADLIPALFAAFLGKGAFNVVNALMLGLLAHLLSLLSVQRRSITAVAIFLAVVGTCYPVPGETMLWMAGSANYLWAITLSLLLIYLLRWRKNAPLTIGEAALWLIGGFVAGGFNEATSFGFFAGLCLYYIFNRSQLNRRAVIALAGYLLGMVLIISSPAAWNRAADGGITLNLPLDELIKTRWFIFHEKAWRFYLPLAAVAVGLIAMLLRRGHAVRQSVWTYIFICLTLVVFALGLLHERAWAPWVTVSLLIMLTGIDEPLSRWPWLRVAAIGLALALTVFTFGRGIKKLSEYRTFNRQVENEIAASATQTVLPERLFQGYSRFIKPMNYESDSFFGHEVVYRAYYGKRNVQFVSDSVYRRFNEERLLDGAELLPTVNDRPDLIGNAYTFPGQDYMAVELLQDTLPATFQTARYLTGAHENAAMSPESAQRRANYGINLDYAPMGFYPIEYQGKCYFISIRPTSSTTQIIFPLDITPSPAEATLTITR